MRCSGFKGSADGDSSYGITAMQPGVLAAHSEQGYFFDQKDSNDGTTEEACNRGGGGWIPYTCSEAEQFFMSEESFGLPEEQKQYLKEFWWAGKCCMTTAEDVVESADGQEGTTLVGNDVDGDQEEVAPVDRDVDNNDTSTTSSVMKKQTLICVLFCVSSFVSFF